jgi:hypothetical protein
MDNGVATDNIIDTTISQNKGSKLPDNVTFNNSHKTWNNSANKVKQSRYRSGVALRVPGS